MFPQKFLFFFLFVQTSALFITSSFISSGIGTRPSDPPSRSINSLVDMIFTFFANSGVSRGKKSAKPLCLLLLSASNRYRGSFGGSTKVLPVAAAITKIISMDMRTLFQPPRSVENDMYFSSLSLWTKGERNSWSLSPCGLFQYAIESIFISHLIVPLDAPSSAGVSDFGLPASARCKDFPLNISSVCILINAGPCGGSREISGICSSSPSLISSDGVASCSIS
mmetsp:Transcript_17946/g.41381  ORF Transcript_17946/g.41381 Transcript_17946/m.41381 type:complete len:224 (+) Transcript_17946:1113-1784(+)